VRRCQEVGLKVGLRFTLNKANFREVPAIFDLVAAHRIPRICFYHLVYTGRGSELLDQALSHARPARPWT
jgi:Fe-coproporphyrin III synthase